MNNIPEHIANIRYGMSQVVDQTDKVHTLLQANDLDLETVQLNMKDLAEQMEVVISELRAAYTIIEGALSEPTNDGTEDKDN